jgi:hypothetical protein
LKAQAIGENSKAKRCERRDKNKEIREERKE